MGGSLEGDAGDDAGDDNDGDETRRTPATDDGISDDGIGDDVGIATTTAASKRRSMRASGAASALPGLQEEGGMDEDDDDDGGSGAASGANTGAGAGAGAGSEAANSSAGAAGSGDGGDGGDGLLVGWGGSADDSADGDGSTAASGSTDADSTSTSGRPASGSNASAASTASAAKARRRVGSDVLGAATTLRVWCQIIKPSGIADGMLCIVNQDLIWEPQPDPDNEEEDHTYVHRMDAVPGTVTCGACSDVLTHRLARLHTGTCGTSSVAAGQPTASLQCTCVGTAFVRPPSRSSCAATAVVSGTSSTSRPSSGTPWLERSVLCCLDGCTVKRLATAQACSSRDPVQRKLGRTAG